MSNILDSAGHKLATIGQDGIVYNVLGVKLGRVLDNGDVHNNSGVKIGSYRGDGYVFEAGNHIGTIHSDGRIYDYETDYIGKVAGDHMQSGGAALLLLVR